MVLIISSNREMKMRNGYSGSLSKGVIGKVRVRDRGYAVTVDGDTGFGLWINRRDHIHLKETL